MRLIKIETKVITKIISLLSIIINTLFLSHKDKKSKNNQQSKRIKLHLMTKINKRVYVKFKIT